jgi:hypothetical protein
MAVNGNNNNNNNNGNNGNNGDRLKKDGQLS